MFSFVFVLCKINLYPAFYLWDYMDISSYIADKYVNIGTGAILNLNNPNISAYISERAVINILAAIAGVGGAITGLRVAPGLAGGMGVKYWAVVLAITAIMFQVLKPTNNNDNSTTSD